MSNRSGVFGNAFVERMKWFRKKSRRDKEQSAAALKFIQEKFKHFLSLLDANNRALKIISDMEEKSQGEYLFDTTYVRKSLDSIRSDLNEIADHIMALGGKQYEPLKDKIAAIDSQINNLLAGSRPIEEDEFTIPFDQLNKERAFSVGSKNAQLGEIKSRVGLPVPNGFAISAWAYKHFIEANDLQERITECIRSLDVKKYEDLVRVSDEIRSMMLSSPIPEDLENAINTRFTELKKDSSSERFALRSSALGEDTLYSFAGQYATLLNIKSEEVASRYREVLASKFTPKAIYYFMSQSLSESDLAMSVGCIEMIDARAAGVIYTRDPVRPEDESLIIHSIFGLGKYLVDGTLTPDLFRVARRGSAIRESVVARKPVRLVMQPEGGTKEEEVPAPEQELPSISEDEIFKLSQFAVHLEEHYGCPQDIEWAIDSEDRPYILQSRPLRVIGAGRDAEMPDVSRLKKLASKGITVCPGAGSGPVFHARSSHDLSNIAEGAVLVAPNPFPGLVAAMGKVSAIVTRVGGVASHMATLAREYRIPTLVGVEGAGDLPAGELVTVDATGGSIYAGTHQEIIDARQPEYDLFSDLPIFDLLEAVLEKVSPLNLLHPRDPGFSLENCETFHDITRFAHQRATEAMFSSATNMDNVDSISLRLKSDIPLQVNVIFIDRELPVTKGERYITIDEIESEPMKAFWRGVLKEGWPSRRATADVKGVVAMMITTAGGANMPEFREQSFVIIGSEYLLCNLRMGYHLSRIEAMCTDDPGKNYIRMQFKGGGTTRERRIRRVKLITDILAPIGFENESRGDFLDAKLSYETRQDIIDKLHILGRLTILTKQLDMALTNDKISQWYTRDFIKKLGIDRGGIAKA